MQLLPDPPTPGGAIAQLGERLVCNQEVAGSIPAGSTSSTRPLRENARDDASSWELTPTVQIPTCAGVIARFVVLSANDADERIVCSLTIWKVFVLTLSFQAKDDDFSQAWKCRVRMYVNQLHIPKLLGVIWSSE